MFMITAINKNKKLPRCASYCLQPCKLASVNQLSSKHVNHDSEERQTVSKHAVRPTGSPKCPITGSSRGIS